MGSEEVGAASSGSGQGGLTWVGTLLVAGGAGPGDVVVAPTPPAGYRSALSFRALPNARHPYLLMPIDSRRAAAGSVHHIGNPLKRRVRVAESALSLSFQLGVGQRVLNQQLHVCVPEELAEQPTLIDRARSLMGDDDLTAAVILGRDRPNRKPVLKLLRRDGEPVAFAKVGWNDVSRALVRHEAAVLAGLADDPPRSFRVPSIIAFDRQDEIDLLLVTPMPQASGLRGGPPSSAPMRATREVAATPGITWHTLTSSPYWASVRARVLEAVADRTNPIGADQEALVEILESTYGARDVVFGAWHGDWTPWNMTSVDDTLFVWDWERADDPVPVGLDLVHFDFDVRVKIEGRSPGRAAHASILEDGPRLESLGLPSGMAHLLAGAHLLEMTLRFQQARTQGVDVTDTIYGPALRAMLRSRTAA
jgi:hypothetical protein